MFKVIEGRYVGGRNSGGWEYEELGIFPSVEVAQAAPGPGLDWRPREGFPGQIAYLPCDCPECRGEAADDIYRCPAVHYVIEPAEVVAHA